MRHRLYLIALFCLLAGGLAAQDASGPDKLSEALAKSAQGNYAAAIPVLEQLSVGAPTEPAFYYLGHAYLRDNKMDKAAAAFEDGAAKFPLSARLHYAAALAYEQRLDLAKALPHFRTAMVLDPLINNTGGGRYDAGQDKIYIPVVHDHRGANSCAGRIYIDDTTMDFVVYIVASGWGVGNDDSFRAPFSQIDYAEVDRKKGEIAIDYSTITLLTNLSGPRRRLASQDDARVDIKFVFKTPIEGYRGRSWTKQDIKFFFVEPEVGERFLKFLEAHGVKITQRAGG